MEGTMSKKKLGFTLTARLEAGTTVLQAARRVDTTLVKARLASFAKAQRSYEEAQRQVAAADAKLREGQVRLARCDAEQDAALEQLARALVTAGQPRPNPFAAFGGSSPSKIKDLNPAAKVDAVYQLTTAVQRQKALDKVALSAARAAEKAGQQAAAEVLAVERLQATATGSRRARDNIGRTWKSAFEALKLGARSADIDGAPGLYTALFGQPSRVRKKAAAPPTPAPAPPTVTVSTA
jgi:hypothetical protein